MIKPECFVVKYFFRSVLIQLGVLEIKAKKTTACCGKRIWILFARFKIVNEN